MDNAAAWPPLRPGGAAPNGRLTAAENCYVNVSPPGIGLVVFLGTLIAGLLTGSAEYLAAYIVVGLVHGGMAALASWIGFSAVQFYRELRDRR